MNKPHRASTLTALVIWSIVAALLIGILTFGIASNGRFLYRPISFTGWSFGWDTGGAMQETKKDIDADGIKQITVSGVSADISISITDDPQIHVTLRAPQDEAKAATDAVAVSDGTLHVTTDQKWVFSLFGWAHHSTVALAIPRNYAGDLDLQTTSGDVTLPESLQVGKLNVVLVSGGISGGEVTATSASLQSVSGNIRLDQLQTGTFTLKETSGDIRVSRLSGSGTAKLVSGDLEAGIESLESSNSISTVSGDVTLRFSPEAAVNLSADTLSGDVDSDFALKKAGRNDYSGPVGTGPSASLDIHTTSGNIQLKSE